MSIKTNLYIERIDGEKREIKKVRIPSNNPTGAHAKYELQLVAGRLAALKLLNETLFCENIDMDWWLKNIGETEKK